MLVVPVENLPHAGKRRCEALVPIRQAVEVDAVSPPVGQDAFCSGHRLVGPVPPGLAALAVGNGAFVPGIGEPQSAATKLKLVREAVAMRLDLRPALLGEQDLSYAAPPSSVAVAAVNGVPDSRWIAVGLTRPSRDCCQSS